VRIIMAQAIYPATILNGL